MPPKKPTPIQSLIAHTTERMPLPQRPSMTEGAAEQALRETFGRFEDAFLGQLEKFKLPVPEAIWEQHVHDADAEIKISTRKRDIKSLEESKKRRDDSSAHPLLSYSAALSAYDNLLRSKTGMEDYTTPSMQYQAIHHHYISIAQAVWQGNDTETLVNALATLLYNESDYDKVAATPEDATKAAMKVVDAAKKAKQEALGLAKQPRGR